MPLPGALWIIVRAVLGGAVQDFVIRFSSMRRDGKSLGQMAREEVRKLRGGAALLTVLFIMIILLAVIAPVVVNWIGILRGTREAKVNEAPYVMFCAQPEDLLTRTEGETVCP